MIVVSFRPLDRFNFISSKLPLYDTFVFIRPPPLQPLTVAARQPPPRIMCGAQPPGNSYGQKGT